MVYTRLWMEFKKMNKYIAFIKLIKKYLPFKSRIDEGVDFNLRQLHIMTEDLLKELEAKNETN